MDTSKYKEMPYTMQIDWEGGTVWLNNHISKEKIVINKKVLKSINNLFELIDKQNKVR